MGGGKIARSHIDQLCFAASIGEVRNSRQKWTVSKSLGRTSINRSVAPRSVKCVTVVKNNRKSLSLGYGFGGIGRSGVDSRARD